MRHNGVQSSLCYYIYRSPNEAVLTLQAVEPPQAITSPTPRMALGYAVALITTVQKFCSDTVIKTSAVLERHARRLYSPDAHCFDRPRLAPTRIM